MLQLLASEQYPLNSSDLEHKSYKFASVDKYLFLNQFLQNTLFCTL